MSAIHLVGAIISAGLFVYLTIAMLKPEKF